MPGALADDSVQATKVAAAKASPTPENQLNLLEMARGAS